MPSNNRLNSIYTFLTPRSKKGILVSGIRPGEIFLSRTTCIVEIVSEYIFFDSKRKTKKYRHTHKQKGKETKKY